MLIRCLKLPSQGSGDALHPAGWQRRNHTTSVPDKAIGVTSEAAVTLQTEAQNRCQNLTLLPHGEVQVPATPGAPPEVFVEARMVLWAAILGLFYIRIESTGKTILTDFLFGGSVICRFLQTSVDSIIPLAHTFGPNNKVCILDNLF